MRRQPSVSGVTVFENSGSTELDFDFAWIHRIARGRVKQIAHFAQSKLTLRPPSPDGDWQPRAWRSDVLLPTEVDDLYREPKLLFTALDAAVSSPESTSASR